MEPHRDSVWGEAKSTHSETRVVVLEGTRAQNSRRVLEELYPSNHLETKNDGVHKDRLFHAFLIFVILLSLRQ